MAVVSRRMRVLVNGVDISDHVRGLDVRAACDCVVTARLELVACPTIGEDGTVSFNLPGRPVGGLIPSPDGALRGIVIRAEEP